ncbi:ElaA protein [Ruminococcus sp. YE71]|nr:ElaA protein [Ruminococcus sp. YE78]SFW46186.1 ElaA protein [Ruminococcus sp. YE71]
MTIKVRYFDELTLRELYEILRARSEVFVVEQECVCQDMDRKDYDSLHVFAEEDDGSVGGCLRLFQRDEDTVQLGRVVTVEHGKGLGGLLLHEGVRQARKHFTAKKIYLEAQCYAIGYYRKAGFEVCSGEFILDGIPHVSMELEL